MVDVWVFSTPMLLSVINDTRRDLSLQERKKISSGVKMVAWRLQTDLRITI